MKANEFFKAIGIKSVKQFLENDNIRTKEMHDDLKRLVESHELVEKHGGIDSLIDLFCVPGMRSVRLMAVDGLTYARAMQAIADVESCQ